MKNSHSFLIYYFKPQRNVVYETKEEVNLVGKGKGKNFKKRRGSNPKQGTKVLSKKKTTGNARCKFCDKQELHSKRKDCPAYNQKCGFCQKWHHFASVRCMTRKKDEVHLLEENCGSSDESILKVEEISTVESSGNRVKQSNPVHEIQNAYSQRTAT